MEYNCEQHGVLLKLAKGEMKRQEVHKEVKEVCCKDCQVPACEAHIVGGGGGS